MKHWKIAMKNGKGVWCRRTIFLKHLQLFIGIFHMWVYKLYIIENWVWPYWLGLDLGVWYTAGPFFSSLDWNLPSSVHLPPAGWPSERPQKFFDQLGWDLYTASRPSYRSSPPGSRVTGLSHNILVNRFFIFLSSTYFLLTNRVLGGPVEEFGMAQHSLLSWVGP